MRQVGAARRKPRGRNKATFELLWDIPTSQSHGSESNELKTSNRESAADGDARWLRNVHYKVVHHTLIRSLSGELDPFGTASVKLDAPSRELLDYFEYFASRFPNTWTFSSSPMLPSSPSEYRRSLQRTIRSALLDPMLGNCLLATAAARVSTGPAGQDITPRFKQKYLVFTQAAIQLLQSRLDNLQDEPADTIEMVVACMQNLGGAAFYCGDLATARLHIKAAITLSSRIGGVQALRDPYTRGRIISFDDLISCIDLRPCLVGDFYDPGFKLPSQALGLGQSLSAKPTALGWMKCEAILPSELMNPILQVTQYQSTRRHVLTLQSTSTFETLANRQWLALRLLAIRNRLLALEIEDHRANIVRVAMLTWTLLPVEDQSECLIVSKVAPKLQQMLQKSDRTKFKGCEDVHLWCLLVGYTGSTENTEVSTWFGEEIFWHLQKSGGHSVGSSGFHEWLVAFQKRFLYDETVQKAATEQLAHSLRQHQDYLERKTPVNDIVQPQ
jgi:hypothetical protein